MYRNIVHPGAKWDSATEIDGTVIEKSAGPNPPPTRIIPADQGKFNVSNEDRQNLGLSPARSYHQYDFPDYSDYQHLNITQGPLDMSRNVSYSSQYYQTFNESQAKFETYKSSFSNLQDFESDQRRLSMLYHQQHDSLQTHIDSMPTVSPMTIYPTENIQSLNDDRTSIGDQQTNLHLRADSSESSLSFYEKIKRAEEGQIQEDNRSVDQDSIATFAEGQQQSDIDSVATFAPNQASARKESPRVIEQPRTLIQPPVASKSSVSAEYAELCAGLCEKDQRIANLLYRVHELRSLRLKENLAISKQLAQLEDILFKVDTNLVSDFSVPRLPGGHMIPPPAPKEKGGVNKLLSGGIQEPADLKMKATSFDKYSFELSPRDDSSRDVQNRINKHSSLRQMQPTNQPPPSQDLLEKLQPKIMGYRLRNTGLLQQRALRTMADINLFDDTKLYSEEELSVVLNPNEIRQLRETPLDFKDPRFQEEFIQRAHALSHLENKEMTHVIHPSPRPYGILSGNTVNTGDNAPEPIVYTKDIQHYSMKQGERIGDIISQQDAEKEIENKDQLDLNRAGIFSYLL